MLNRDKVQIDFVFTDLRMLAKMDGWGLAAWIRENHPEKSVIVTSSEYRQAADDLFWEIPFLQKPSDFGPVAARIAALVRENG